MKKIILFILVILAMVLIAGCTQKEQVDEDSCGAVSPDSRDECCAMENEGKPAIACEGDWTYNENSEECVFQCTGSETGGEVMMKGSNEDYCYTDDDCVCGVSLLTAECAIGNRDYIDIEDYREEEGDYLDSAGPADEGEKEVIKVLVKDGGICRQYCNGELGQYELRCVNNKCTR